MSFLGSSASWISYFSSSTGGVTLTIGSSEDSSICSAIICSNSVGLVDSLFSWFESVSAVLTEVAVVSADSYTAALRVSSALDASEESTNVAVSVAF